MINKSIYVIMFMLSINGGILIVQYVIADFYGMELTNHNGDPYRSQILSNIGVDRINEATTKIETTPFEGNVSGQPFNRIIDFNVGMAYTVWEFVSLLTGLYVFFVLVHFGAPEFVVAIMAIAYTFLLIRTIIGLLRGF